MVVLLPLISIGYSPLGSVYVAIGRYGRAAVGAVLTSLSVGIRPWLPLLSLSGGSVLFAWAGFFLFLGRMSLCKAVSLRSTCGGVRSRSAFTVKKSLPLRSYNLEDAGSFYRCRFRRVRDVWFRGPKTFSSPRD